MEIIGIQLTHRCRDMRSIKKLRRCCACRNAPRSGSRHRATDPDLFRIIHAFGANLRLSQRFWVNLHHVLYEPGWKGTLPVFDKDWNPYLNGKVERAKAIPRFVADYGIKRSQ